ncbi:sensor histidine kinase [uncultured Bartonella sp.]|uniref:sensor histidine kinase n=1 Tax=uncultured Bartonella sp. TaxID=104108 RepID=UPI0025E95F22|nr:sensor histidine kinase [uncultured Bartonella sp.]
MTSHFSLRRRISIIALSLLLITGGIILYFMQNSIEHATESAYDRLLLASARTIANAVQTEKGKVAVEIPGAAFSMFPGDDRIFYVIRDSDGGYVTGYKQFDNGMALAHQTGGTFQNAFFNNEPVRIVTVGRLIATEDKTGWVTIRIGQTRREQQSLKSNILYHETIAVAALMFIALCMIWFAIGLTFSPLKKLENELRDRCFSDLSPLESPSPNEVNALVIALNVFMERLKLASERMRTLVADAAHQIRTPLASLLSQIEVAIHERNEVKRHEQLLKVERSAIQASRLVNQLLMDATITHRLEQKSDDQVNIEKLLDDVVNRIQSSEQERIHIKADASVKSAIINGDRIALREMLHNLVDNALRYTDGAVIIAPTTTADQLSIRIIDSGPGIKKSEREIVFQRFQRGSTAGTSIGSGLGLAIALQVVKAHHGTIKLEDIDHDRGFCVEITFPLVSPNNRYV